MIQNDVLAAARAMPRARAPDPRTSEMLLALVAGTAAERITVAELAAGLKTRVVGMIMLIFAIPCVIPTPPGVPFACGFVILTCGIHLLIGRERLWLPGFIARRSFSRALLEKVVARAVPVSRRLERFCRPRFGAATGRLGRAVLGLVVIVLAIILLLPIPVLGNMPPGLSAALIALGLIERDGVVILAGHIASVAAIALTSTMAWGALLAVSALL